LWFGLLLIHDEQHHVFICICVSKRQMYILKRKGLYLLFKIKLSILHIIRDLTTMNSENTSETIQHIISYCSDLGKVTSNADMIALLIYSLPFSNKLQTNRELLL
jgi:predicted acetyltransferase